MPIRTALHAAVLQVHVFSIILVTICAQHLSGPYRSSLIGTYQLPNLTSTVLPAMCNDFADACAAEAAGDHYLAIKLYEERYPVCGDHGWNLIGHSQGFNDFVLFKTTPCGLPVAIKSAVHPAECIILKHLTVSASSGICPGCFPRFYYLSNFTQACYTEDVPQLNRLNWGFPGKYNKGDFLRVKHLYLETLSIVRVLRAHNIEHRDYTFRNILLRNATRPDGTVHPQVVFVDFGSAKQLNGEPYPVKDDEYSWASSKHGAPRALASSTGNPTSLRHKRRISPVHSYLNDVFAVTCMFSSALGHATCTENVVPLPPTVPNYASLRYALRLIMNRYADRPIEPDFPWIGNVVRNTTQF
jgi:hypothetical protein